VSNKTVMLIAIDSETPEGKALISEIDGRFMRAEWVDRAHYAPMLLLEKAEARFEELEEKLALAERCIRTRESWAGYCALELMPKLDKEARPK
jgi:hypothetical protein